VIVKGKTQPVSIFESLDYHDDASFPNMMETIGLFAEGLARYREADFEAASTWFDRAIAASPGDRLSAIYQERCRQLSKAPPPGDWDGVWAMTEK
jgi:adenylate cyclase